MNENSIYWILGAVFIALLITIFGIITGRNLPARRKKLRIQKFAAVGLAFFAFSVPIFKPSIFSFSRTEFLDDLKAENLNSVEALAKFEKEQSRQIERLKEEVKDLREDLYSANRFYSAVIQFSSTAVVTLLIGFAFRKRKNEEDLEEIQSDQVLKL